MSTELAVRQEQAKKQIGAMIEGVVMQRPELMGKLNMAIATSYLKLPDESFGWIAKGEMSREVKLMAIASHLQTGAMPGYGHIYFLGNKLYQSAAFIQSKANSDPNFNFINEAVFEPFSESEKEMFGIGQGDMACKVILEIDMNGKTFTATGHGIVGKDEISRNKPGLTSLKNRAMTLKTRAMRDLLSRFYPTNGVPVGPDASEEVEAVQAGYTDQLKIVEPAAIEKVREEIKIEEAELVEEKTKEQAKEDYKKIVSEARTKKIVNKDMLAAAGMKNVKTLFANDVDDIYDYLEIMQDYVDNYSDEPEPDPEPVKEEKGSILSNPHVEAAKSRLKLQTIEATDAGLKAMSILGENPHNIVERGDIKEMMDAGNRLVDAIKESQKKPVDDLDDPFAEDEKPIAEKAYKKVEMLLKHDSVTDKKLIGILEGLRSKMLKEGDEELIVDAGRQALKGDFTYIEKFRDSRENI